jgi:predicted RND superfamily exporter protein
VNGLFQKILRAFRADVAVPVLADFITARPRALALATLGVGLLLAAGAAGLRARHTVDDFFIDDTDNGRFLSAFRERFPNGEFFVVAYDDPALFTTDGVDRLKTLTRNLAELPDVKEVKSLANVTDIRGEDDAFIVQPFLRDVPADAAGLERLRARAVGHRLYEKQFVSPDGRTAAVVVFVHDPPPDEGYRRRALAAVDGVLDRHKAMGPFDRAGWTVTNVSVVEYMMKDFQTFIPFTFLLVGAVSWFVFRNPRLIALALVNVALTLGATLGLSRAAGFSLNVISSIAVPLIMSLALTDTVHVFTHLDRRLLERHTPTVALNLALREILRPSFVTSLNTGLGFFSLTFSRTPAIREFGWMGAAGMALEFLFTFGFLAPAVLFFRPEKIFRAVGTESDNRLVAGFLLWVNRTVQRFPGRILLLGALAFGLSAWSARSLTVESDLLAYFPAKDKLTQAVRRVEDKLGGVGLLEISVKGPAAAFKEPSALAFLDRLQGFLNSRPGVDKTLSVADLFKEMNREFHNGDPAADRLPDRRRLVEQYLLLYDGDDLDDLVTPDFAEARVAVRVRDHRTSANARLIAAVDDFARREAPPALTVRTTGEIRRAVDSVDVYMRDQLQSLALAVVFIWIVMAVVLRSMALSVLFLVPNLFPIVVNFGVMAAAGIPLDTGTLLIASCAFGVVVDDTVHYFVALRERRLRHRPIREAVQEVLLLKGEGSTASLLILSAGFGVLMLGHFVPVFEFGRLNLLIMAVGAAGDMFVMNALLLVTARRRYQTPLGSLPAASSPPI